MNVQAGDFLLAPIGRHGENTAVPLVAVNAYFMPDVGPKMITVKSLRNRLTDFRVDLVPGSPHLLMKVSP
jgi:hypothetical protein